MRTIAKHKALLRATSATLCLAFVFCSSRRAVASRRGRPRRGAECRARQNPDAQQPVQRRPAASARPHHPAYHGLRHPARRTWHGPHLCEYPRRRCLRSRQCGSGAESRCSAPACSRTSRSISTTAPWRSGWSKIPSSIRWCSRGTTRFRPRISPRKCRSSRAASSPAPASRPMSSASSSSIAGTANSPPASIPRSSSGRRTASI